VAGVLLLYYTCLKFSENSWTDKRPPGPLHIVGIGSLLHMISAGSLSCWLDSLLTTYGPVCRYCLPNTRLVLVNHDHNFESVVGRSRMSEVTVSESVLSLLHSLGIKIEVSEWVVAECAGLARMFYNFVLSTEEFMELMKSAENYRQDLHIKKTEKLLGTILEKQITFGKVERELVSKSFQEMDKFKDTFLTSRPAVWLPTYCLLPHVYFERKKFTK